MALHKTTMTSNISIYTGSNVREEEMAQSVPGFISLFFLLFLRKYNQGGHCSLSTDRFKQGWKCAVNVQRC